MRHTQDRPFASTKQWVGASGRFHLSSNDSYVRYRQLTRLYRLATRTYPKLVTLTPSHPSPSLHTLACRFHHLVEVRGRQRRLSPLQEVSEHGMATLLIRERDVDPKCGQNSIQICAYFKLKDSGKKGYAHRHGLNESNIFRSPMELQVQFMLVQT